mmetsp:Transcript_11042/g.23466  ORF Transcript_11042/g.23466 Transcript_11042/m.23466 type:complete len:115 (+) Transcript_11042:751-1095(+)
MVSPFSFHCIICYEEFDIETRFPVVLPCGHTYICNECAHKIDYCTECRTPLFEMMPQNECAKAPVEQLPGWSSRSLGKNNSRNAPGRQQQQPNKKPPPPLKRRLLLPKNVVLIP